MLKIENIFFIQKACWLTITLGYKAHNHFVSTIHLLVIDNFVKRVSRTSRCFRDG